MVSGGFSRLLDPRESQGENLGGGKSCVLRGGISAKNKILGRFVSTLEDQARYERERRKMTSRPMGVTEEARVSG